MVSRFTALPLAMAGLCCASPALADYLAGSRIWNFDVKLDGKPIGQHTFTVEADGTRIKASNVARFAVKILGITVYRYSLDDHEQWSGDCLHGMQSQTNDDGDKLEVRAQRDGAWLRVRGGKTPVDTQACVMAYAYWYPQALRQQTQLLNPQTGVLDAVSMREAGESLIDVGEQRIKAKRLRITAPPGDLDVWLNNAGDWIGLDAKVSGGRTVQYRLRAWPAWMPRNTDGTAQQAAPNKAQP